MFRQHSTASLIVPPDTIGHSARDLSWQRLALLLWESSWPTWRSEPRGCQHGANPCWVPIFVSDLEVKDQARRLPPPGAASIIVHETRGENAIVVVPGACNQLTTAEIDGARDEIAGSAVFLTQLEQPLALAEHALKLARGLNVITILNPAPAAVLPPSIYELCDYLTPNETEAEWLTGTPVKTEEEVEQAAKALLRFGVRNVIVTLGERGAMVKSASVTKLVLHCKPGAF